MGRSISGREGKSQETDASSPAVEKGGAAS